MGNQIGVDVSGSLLRVACAVDVHPTQIASGVEGGAIPVPQGSSDTSATRADVGGHVGWRMPQCSQLRNRSRYRNRENHAITSGTSGASAIGADGQSAGVDPSGCSSAAVCEGCGCPNAAQIQSRLKRLRRALAVGSGGSEEKSEERDDRVSSSSPCAADTRAVDSVIISKGALRSSPLTTFKRRDRCGNDDSMEPFDADWEPFDCLKAHERDEEGLSNMSETERTLWFFLAIAPLCEMPLCFCVGLLGLGRSRMYSFFIDTENAEVALRLAIPLLPVEGCLPPMCVVNSEICGSHPAQGTAPSSVPTPYIEVTGAGGFHLGEILSRMSSKGAEVVDSHFDSSPPRSPSRAVGVGTVVQSPTLLLPSPLVVPSRNDGLALPAVALWHESSSPAVPSPLRIVAPSSDARLPAAAAIPFTSFDYSPLSTSPRVGAIRSRPENSSGGERTVTGVSGSLKPQDPNAIRSSVQLQYHREITCVLEALDFLVCHAPSALFSFGKTNRGLNSVIPDAKDYIEVPITESDTSAFYPFLLINLKAGVSFHKVDAPGESCRIGGSPIGGATFMGLLRLLCPDVKSPLDAFLLAQSGDNSGVDMLVSDIYGGDYPAIGLKGTTIASTFGKQMHRGREGRRGTRLMQTRQQHEDGEHRSEPGGGDDQQNKNGRDDFDDELGGGYNNVGDDNNYCSELLGGMGPDIASAEDICRSLLTMMSFNVAQLAYFHSVIHNCKRIVLVGYYLDMPGYLASFQHCIDFWSGGSCKIVFVRMAPFLGALGASLRTRRRRTSTAFLPDWTTDDRTPSPHRMIFHLKNYIAATNAAGSGLE